MSLTRKERRALHAVERALTIEDPALASLLRSPPAPVAPAQVVERFALCFVLLSLILLAAGVLFDDSAMLSGGVLVLEMFPPTILLMAAALGSDR